MTPQLMYIALGFGSGLIVAAMVGTLALLRWSGKSGPDVGEAEAPPEVTREISDDLSTGEVYELPVVISMTEKGEATSGKAAIPHYNVRGFLINYTTVRKEDVSAGAEDVPSATQLEKLLAVTHDKNTPD